VDIERYRILAGFSESEREYYCAMFGEPFPIPNYALAPSPIWHVPPPGAHRPFRSNDHKLARAIKREQASSAA